MFRGLMLVLACGCGRIGFDSPYDHELVVTTAADRYVGPASAASVDELDGSDPDLSLREALTIANNASGVTHIGFAPKLADATISASTALPPLTGTATVIDGNGVTIDAAPGYTGVLLEVRGQQSVVRGLIWRGAGTRLQLATTDAVISGNRFESGGVAIAGTGLRVAITNNEILGAGGNGIELTDSSDVIINGNDIDDVAGDPVFMQASSNVEISSNWVAIGSAGTGRGVVLVGVTAARIHDNLIDPGSEHLVRLVDSPDAQVIGNILEAGDASVVVEGSSTSAYIFRNVMMMPLFEPIYLGPAATGAVIMNNTFYLCASGVAGGPGDAVETNTLDTDTGFVDPAGYDFRLMPDSSAIDRGVDVGQDMLPRDANRFLGGAPDLGAVETR